MFLARKSIPTVGLVRNRYVGCFFETVVDVSLDDAGLADVLAAQEDDFNFGFASHGADGMVHLDRYYNV